MLSIPGEEEKIWHHQKGSADRIKFCSGKIRCDDETDQLQNCEPVFSFLFNFHPKVLPLIFSTSFFHFPKKIRGVLYWLQRN